jgi:GNAT superfamily N-acetyltransferase
LDAQVIDLSLVQVVAEDAAAIEKLYGLQVERHAFDVPYDPPPSRRDLVADVTYPWEDQRVEHWLAGANGDAVGSVTLRFPVLENMGKVSVDLAVRPSRRRHGIGRRLVEHAIERARADNRSRMTSEILVDGPVGGRGRGFPGPAFARAMGARPALQEVRRRLDLDRVDPSLHAQLFNESEAASGDYHLMSWESAIPDQVLDEGSPFSRAG